jgi:hypothetical protein
MSDRKALAREIAARTKPRFIEIRRERGGGKVPFTEEQLTDIKRAPRQVHCAGLRRPRVRQVREYNSPNAILKNAF